MVSMIHDPLLPDHVTYLFVAYVYARALWAPPRTGSPPRTPGGYVSLQAAGIGGYVAVGDRGLAVSGAQGQRQPIHPLVKEGLNALRSQGLGQDLQPLRVVAAQKTVVQLLE